MGLLGVNTLPKAKDDKNQHGYFYITMISYILKLLICLK